MPDVIFNEPRLTQQEREAMRETTKILDWLIKIGIAKTESQAILISIGFVIVAIVVSLFLFFGGSKKNIPPPKIMDNNFNQTI